MTDPLLPHPNPPPRGEGTIVKGLKPLILRISPSLTLPQRERGQTARWARLKPLMGLTCEELNS